MRWILAAAVAGALAWGCGGGGTTDDPEALIQAAVDAVVEPGMVFHAKTVEGIDIWIDGERDLFRTQMGEEGDSSFRLSVGEGWTVWSLHGSENEVEEEKLEPPADHPSRIDNPAVVLGLGPLAWLAYGENVEVVGEKESDGRDVVVVETREEILEGSSDYREGSTRVWRVELDRESHLVVAYEMQVIPPEGEGEEEEGEEGLYRVVYEVTEFIPREELPEDFFSPEVLYDAVVTFEERLEDVRALGVTPYWLGERFEAEEGELALSRVWDISVSEARGEAWIGYTVFTPDAPSRWGWQDAVRIALKPAEGAVFEPPSGPRIGPKPELEEDVTVHGQDAILYTSELNPEGVPCAVGEPCILPDVPLYSRVVVTLDDTAIQVEARSRLELGADRNPFNNQEAILALARALEPAE